MISVCDKSDNSVIEDLLVKQSNVNFIAKSYRQQVEGLNNWIEEKTSKW
jgi:hypothetical protein